MKGRVPGPFHDTKGILNWDITSLQGLQARASWNPKTLAGLVKTGWEFCTADLCFGVNGFLSEYFKEFVWSRIFCRFFEKVLILARWSLSNLLSWSNLKIMLRCLLACLHVNLVLLHPEATQSGWGCHVFQKNSWGLVVVETKMWIT